MKPLRCTYVLATAGTLLLASCGAPPAQTAQATRTNIKADVFASGLVVPSLQSKLNFHIAGTFKDYQVTVGDHVKANQPLATIEAPDQDLAVAKAQYDLASAQAGLATAQAKLDAITAGPKPGVVEQAQGNLGSAQGKIAQLAAQGRAEDIASKQSALDAAKAKLDQMLNPRPEDVAKAKAALDQAQAKLQILKDGLRPEQVQVLHYQVDQARDSLLSAQLTRDATCGTGKGSLCDAANASVDAAQSNLNAVNQQMVASTAPPTAAQMAEAQAEVEQAKQALALAQKPYTEDDVQQQRDAVNSAQQALQLAQQPYTPAELTQAQASAQAAEGALTQAQQPYTSQDQAQAQAAIDQAQAQVAYAKASLSNAQLNQSYITLTAPYDATVVAENARPGESVGPGGVSTTTVQTTGGDAVNAAGNAAILLAADKGLDVNLSVSDSDISRISLGQPAVVTFDAYPGVQYHGKVTFIPSTGDTVQNVQQYLVHVTLDDDPSLPVPKQGMTANCTIPLERQNVLVVPNGAIQHDSSGRPMVILKDASSSRDVPVQTGVTDSQWTEIIAGLKEGDRVQVGGGVAAKPAS